MSHELPFQLLEYYHLYDKFQDPKLSDQEALKVFRVLCGKGRIIPSWDRFGKLLGYVETWRITPDQFVRKLAHEPMDVGLEDINSGPIAFVSNVTIHPDFRGSGVLRELTQAFLFQNSDATYFAGDARRKKEGLVKLFRVDKLSHKELKVWAASGLLHA